MSNKSKDMIKDKIIQLKSEIESHPLLQMIEYKMHDPVTKDDVLYVEDHLSFHISENILNFYHEIDGFQISWGLNEAGRSLFDKKDKIFADYEYYGLSKDQTLGKINILSLRKCFVDFEPYFDTDENYEFSLKYKNKTYPGNSFGKLLRPFDIYSDYDCMAFVIQEKMSELEVILLTDSWIVWDSSRATSFGNYLDMLFITRGSIPSRDRIFLKHEGYKYAPIDISKDFIKKFTPKLFI